MLLLLSWEWSFLTTDRGWPSVRLAAQFLPQRVESEPSQCGEPETDRGIAALQAEGMGPETHREAADHRERDDRVSEGHGEALSLGLELSFCRASCFSLRLDTFHCCSGF